MIRDDGDDLLLKLWQVKNLVREGVYNDDAKRFHDALCELELLELAYREFIEKAKGLERGIFRVICRN